MRTSTLFAAAGLAALGLVAPTPAQQVFVGPGTVSAPTGFGPGPIVPAGYTQPAAPVAPGYAAYSVAGTSMPVTGATYPSFGSPGTAGYYPGPVSYTVGNPTYVPPAGGMLPVTAGYSTFASPGGVVMPAYTVGTPTVFPAAAYPSAAPTRFGPRTVVSPVVSMSRRAVRVFR